VYLEINGHDVFVEEDSDFDPICNLSVEIFGKMKSLHTCDIHAWISNIDGGLGSIPEKAVFYRRLPRLGSERNIKELWTSRMDSIYQESDPEVIKHFQVMEGEFEGEDAKEIWLGGYTNERTEDEEGDEKDYSWPGWVDKVDNYAMFRNTT